MSERGEESPADGAGAGPVSPVVRGVAQRVFYWSMWALLQAVATLVYRVRVFGDQRLPPGPLLIVANHQSHLDPPLIGIAVRMRRIAFIARSGLFRNPAMAWVMRTCGAIALKEGESDLAAMRRAIEELRSGHAVGIFPEGSRTPSGGIQGFKRGAWLLMMRAGCDVVPVAIEGAYDAWPRQRNLPRLWGRRVAVAIGKPVEFERLRAMGEEKGLQHLRGIIEDMRCGLARTIASRA